MSVWLTLYTTQAEKLQTLISAAKVADVEPIWTSLFAKVHTPRLTQPNKSAISPHKDNLF